MNLEERILEQRTIEATKKNLIGQEGKIYLIARFLGDEIIYQNDSYDDYDFEQEFNVENMPILSEDTYSRKIGHHYSGLKHANKIEIFTDDYSGEIRLFNDGNLVYKEVFSILESYVPNNNWEEVVDKLQIIIKPKIENFLKNKKKKEERDMKIMENNTIKEIQKRWGNILGGH